MSEPPEDGSGGVSGNWQWSHAFDRQVEMLRPMIRHSLNLRRVFEVSIVDDATIELTEVTHELLRLRRLVELYRSKNHVEYDFRIIKSVLELRPIHHHTDQKVTAHVTLCVLALLLLRHLDAKLRRTNTSAAMAVELLASCRLNRVEMGDFNYYTVTRLNPQQRSLLETLELVELADDNAFEKQISPR